MRNFLIAICLAVAAPAPASAVGTLDDLCKEIGSASEAIMTGRQNGVELSTMMAPFASQDQSDPVVEFLRGAALRAYETPHWNSKDIQRKTISDFRSQMELECYTTFADAK